MKLHYVSILEKYVGASCLVDEECYGQSSVCVGGRCGCLSGFHAYTHPEFQEDSSLAPLKQLSLPLPQKDFCVRAPAEVGAECAGDCAPPLICRDGRCECWQGRVVGGRCVVECPPGLTLVGQSCVESAGLGETCSGHAACRQPHSACIHGHCSCAPGTHHIGHACISSCPDGSVSAGLCSRTFLGDVDAYEHGVKADTCPAGYACMTYGKPFVGHCCRLGCPFGEADKDRSCEVGAAVPCRMLTHQCLRTELGHGWAASLCCPRPCREPYPLYINGECLAEGHLGDRCRYDEQCEGGRSMACEGGLCRCRPVQWDYFPSCIRACAVSEVTIGTGCLEPVVLGAHCLASAQCAAQARCWSGRCECGCGLLVGGLLNNTCIDPFDPLNLKLVFGGVGDFLSGRRLLRPQPEQPTQVIQINS